MGSDRANGSGRSRTWKKCPCWYFFYQSRNLIANSSISKLILKAHKYIFHQYFLKTHNRYLCTKLGSGMYNILVFFSCKVWQIGYLSEEVPMQKAVAFRGDVTMIFIEDINEPSHSKSHSNTHSTLTIVARNSGVRLLSWIIRL